MKFTFSKEKSDYQAPIIFALCLNQKKVNERIVIGEENEVRSFLQKGTGDLYFNETAPLGNIFFTFETDAGHQWQKIIGQLLDGYKKYLIYLRAAEKPLEFLREKYESGVPVAKYAAMRTWIEYLNCYNMNHGSKELETRLSVLYKPFRLYGNKDWQEIKYNFSDNAVLHGESRLDLWYNAKNAVECIVAYNSFQPLLFYYLTRIQEWGLQFNHCRICGQDFLAHRHYNFCGDVCRAKQSTENQRQSVERSRASANEQLYGTTYDYWYNRIRKLKKENAAEAVIAEATVAFETYRSDGVRLKGELEVDDFKAWIDGQTAIVDALVKSCEPMIM